MDVGILGGGYAGVVLARRLERVLPDGIPIRLIDDSGTHVLQHEIHRLIRRPHLRDALEIQLDEILDRTTVLEATVDAVDIDDRAVRLEEGDRLHPSVLAVCLGATTADYGLSGIARHGYPLKRIDHALAIRERVQGLPAGSRVVVGGAGLSGIQVAGELRAFREDLEVVLLEQASSVAPEFPADFRDVVAEHLAKAGVTVRTETTIRSADSAQLAVDGDHPVAFDLFVWTGGIEGSPAVGERPTVRSDLRASARTVVLGDAARVVDDRGAVVPDSAQTAIAQARVAATNIDRLVRVEDGTSVFDPVLDRYVDETSNWVVSIGDDAVALVDGRVVTGRAARGIKAAAGFRYLASMRRIRRSLDLVAEELGLPA